MSAPHFFSADIFGEHVEITGDDARHATGALRLTPGEEITVSDGAGAVVRARVTDAGHSLRADVIARTTHPAPTPRVIVYPAVAKADKNEFVVQKLVELGIDEIRPWFAERTIVRWDAAKAARNADRWRAVAYEAAKQSRRAFLPVVADPAALVDLAACAIVLHEGASARLREVLPEQPGDVVAVVIGPEGGLSDTELESFTARGARLATLGEQILRTETAAVVGPALVLARLNRLA